MFLDLQGRIQNVKLRVFRFFNNLDSFFKMFSTKIKSSNRTKAADVLFFKNAELERNLDYQKLFVDMGMLQILYFEEYNQFVLSLNDWKYPLLKSLPIIYSEYNSCGPITLIFPAHNGFFFLKITKIKNVSVLKNLETILAHTCLSLSSLREIATYKKQGIVPNAQSNQNKFALKNSEALQIEMTRHGSLTKKDKVRKGLKKISNKFTTAFIKKEKYNINFWKQRNFEDMKRTNEYMSSFHFYAKQEVKVC